MRLCKIASIAMLLGAMSAPIVASPFQYGDIFVSTSAGILRFNQSGALLQTMAAGRGGLGFDPSGNLYVASGATVQKFDNSGNALGTFVSGFPGTLGTATDIDFDAAGNAYVTGIQDTNNDFIRKYTNAGVMIGTQSFVEGQENFVYIDAAADGTLLVTPGTTDIVDKFNASTLASLGSVSNIGGGQNGGIEGLSGGGFLVISNDPINQFNSSGSLIGTYNSVLHGSFIGVDSFTATNFWAVSDFGEVRDFNLGTSTPVAAFSTGVDGRDIAVFTIPEPSTIAGFASGLAALAMRVRRRKNAG
jgi:hypothetical protein